MEKVHAFIVGPPFSASDEIPSPLKKRGFTHFRRVLWNEWNDA
jgi:hypothetical protein